MSYIKKLCTFANQIISPMTLKRIKANMKPGTVGWTYAPDGVPMVLVCEPTNKNVKKFTSITDYAFPNTARRGAKRQAARLGFKYMGCLHDA